MDNPKELSPLAKGDIEIGKALPFPIYDNQGVLLLAAGQAIQTLKQLEELSGKGLYQNPRWTQPLSHSKLAKGTVKPTGEFIFNHSKAVVEEPSETGSTLKMNLTSQAEVFSVKLVGVCGKEAFVVTHPMRGDSCIFTKEGQTWEFKSFYGLSVYRFKAMVEKVMLSPHPMLVMSWPQEGHWEAKLIRTARRVCCELPATLRFSEDSDGHRNGVINNLSVGGLELRLPLPIQLQIGAAVVLAFQLTILGRKYLMDLPATVVSKSPHSAGQLLGLSFDALGDHDFSALHAFVCDRLVSKLTSPLYNSFE